MLESHVALGESLCHVLETAGYESRHVAEPTRSVVGVVRERPPAAVVVGVETRGPIQERLALVTGVAGTGTPTIGLTGSIDDPTMRRLLRRAGATWVVGRDETLRRFVEVVSLAVSGEVPEPEVNGGRDLPDDVAAHAAERARVLDGCVERLLRLTPRERAVLEHLSHGRTVDEISRLDHVALSTVRAQTRDVLRKLEVSSQLAAVAMLRWVQETRSRA